MEKADRIEATFSRFFSVCDCSGSIEVLTLNISARKIVRTMLTPQKKKAVGTYKELSGGQSGGNQIIIVVIVHTGKPINKNGRLFPNFPGFLLSIITPKIIHSLITLLHSYILLYQSHLN